MRTFDSLFDVVGRHVSEIHAKSVVTRAFSACGVADREPNARELPRIIGRIERSLRLFLNDDAQELFKAQVQRALPQQDGHHGTEVIDIADEGDIVAARSRARELCTALGADRIAAQKAATIVSELARNIVSYTSGGYVEICPAPERRRLGIKAVDSGKGIPNLDEIFAGRYRSRTGLGMGLRGTKRLASSFDITTGPEGTSIEAWVRI